MHDKTKLPRGVRINNPGNIKVGSRWHGLIPSSDLSSGLPEDIEFVVFRHPLWGLRALSVILQTYAKKHKIKTLRNLVKRYAPKKDGNPEKKYVEFLTKRMGFTSSAKHLDFASYEVQVKLIPAIVQFEQGDRFNTWYSDELLDCALELSKVPGKPALFV